jgi:hypothetical protein
LGRAPLWGGLVRPFLPESLPEKLLLGRGLKDGLLLPPEKPRELLPESRRMPGEMLLLAGARRADAPELPERIPAGPLVRGDWADAVPTRRIASIATSEVVMPGMYFMGFPF